MTRDETKMATSDDFPWKRIGMQGVGQKPMTQTQFDWLKDHNMTAPEYNQLAQERRDAAAKEQAR
jgi:hypothetical protein